MSCNSFEVINPDVIKYQKIFYDLIGDDIVSGENIVDDNLKFFIDHVTATSCPAAAESSAIHEAYILYVIAVNLLEYEKTFKGENFFSTVYLPPIYYATSKYLNNFRQLLVQLETKTYDHVKEKASSIIDFSLVLYNISPTVIKLDTQQIFFKSSFVEISPSDLTNTTDHYYNSLQYIYYNYIKSKTNGLIPIDSLLEVKKSIGFKKDSRYSIYEFGLRSYQIQRICLNSHTLTTISENFEILRSNLVNNQLLQILKSVYFPNIEDEKVLLLKVNSNEFDLVELEVKIPLVCRLLRAIHVNSQGTSLSEIEQSNIRSNIFSTINDWMSKKMNDEQARRISSALSVSLSNSLFKGVYIDPRTMQKIEFGGSVFAVQFRKFIEMMLTKMMRNTI